MERVAQNQKQFSFFDAPTPRYNGQLFARDPAVIGKSITRPSRPIPQVNPRYCQHPVKSMALGGQEVCSSRGSLFV